MSTQVYRSFFKRILDLILTGLLFIAFSPLIILVVILIWISLGRPIFFKHVRPGLHGKLFTVLKFRTMIERHDANGNLLPDQERITPLGRILRKASADEIPQLWNIIRGDMSLVGPRPLLVEYLDYYSDRERRRHDVRPGLTGLAQIKGRNRLTWDRRLELDVQYVETCSLALDLYILLTTVWKVIARSDNIEAPRTVLKPLSECRKKRVEL